jgi:hypothetical protein
MNDDTKLRAVGRRDLSKMDNFLFELGMKDCDTMGERIGRIGRIDTDFF